MFNPESDQPGVSFLNESTWAETFPHSPDLQLATPEFVALPDSFKNEVIGALSHLESAELKSDTNPNDYKYYLQKALHLNPGSPNVLDGLQHHTQKAIAHALLAFADLTEPESHLISLWDTKSIISHAWDLYQLGLQPWFDFAVSEDISSKSQHDVTSKKSALLFKN